MKSKTVLVWILGITGGLSLLFMVVYGGVTDNPALYTPGISTITGVTTAFTGYYFGSKKERIDEH